MKPELGQTAMAKAFFGCQHLLFNAFGIDVVAVADARAEMTMPFPKLLPTAIERCTGAAGDPARHDVRTGHFLRAPLYATIDLRVDYLRAIPARGGRMLQLDRQRGFCLRPRSLSGLTPRRDQGAF